MGSRRTRHRLGYPGNRVNRDKALLLACLQSARAKQADVLTAKGVRDRVASIRTCKHPQRQRDLLYRLLEDVAQSIEALERITQLQIDQLIEEHRAECAEIERRCNEQIDKLTPVNPE